MESFLLLKEKFLSIMSGKGMPLDLSIRSQRLRAILENICLAKDLKFDFLSFIWFAYSFINFIIHSQEKLILDEDSIEKFQNLYSDINFLCKLSLKHKF